VSPGSTQLATREMITRYAELIFDISIISLSLSGHVMTRPTKAHNLPRRREFVNRVR
jgi:hypothetical protein